MLLLVATWAQYLNCSSKIGERKEVSLREPAASENRASCKRAQP